jgi:hypothetical protein
MPKVFGTETDVAAIFRFEVAGSLSFERISNAFERVDSTASTASAM